ncbi:MAG: hypothetical protein WC919_02870 [Candidatus Paceibacterota bacterium]
MRRIIISESSLSLGFGDLQSAVGFFLNYGSTVASFTADQLAEVNRIVQSGVRRVYYPTAVAAQIVGYEWSWLRPSTTLAITAGTWEYNLPDNFGRMIGRFHFPVSTYRDDIQIVPEGKILDLRSHADVTDYPTSAAIRYLSSTGSTGQRQEVIFYPTPSVSLSLSYAYEAYSGALSDSYPYPLGGMQLSELYLESCLAVAESRINDTIGPHTMQYQTLLMDAIARDRKRGAQMYGHMGNREGCGDGWGDVWLSPPFDITYKGVVIN